KPGDCAAWPKGSVNGHHVRNESDSDCAFIVMGGGTNTGGGYSDIDMLFTDDSRYVRRDGTAY
ncbi:MAG TPA: transcriptional regulator, partial [Sphingomicrobium sp.]|nr:transcriptional regulator [Sphingomicrobium sp.]